MIKLKGKTPTHTAKSVDKSVGRPQNKHLKPFKSRAELGGQYDPRINVSGRPKLIRDALNKRLRQMVKIKIKGEDGKEQVVEIPRVELIADAQCDIASSLMPHSVGAFRAIREVVEPTEEEERGSTDRSFIRMLTEVLMERKADAIEV